PCPPPSQRRSESTDCPRSCRARWQRPSLHPPAPFLLRRVGIRSFACLVRGRNNSALRKLAECPSQNQSVASRQGEGCRHQLSLPAPNIRRTRETQSPRPKPTGL